MNNQLLSKIIKTNHETCPDFVFQNPLLDRNLADSLAKSFMKILSSRQNPNVDKNLRLCILEKIRKLCRVEPYEHRKIDDKTVSMITDLHNNHIGGKNQWSFELVTGIAEDEDNLNKMLDEFIVKEMQIDSNYPPELNPEIVQALMNINSYGAYLDNLSTDLIHWNIVNKKQKKVMTHLWRKEDLDIHNKTEIINIVVVKMKADLENELLTISTEIVSNQLSSIDSIFHTNIVQNIVKKCHLSPLCFQMTTRILNTIFITTNFNSKLLSFIQTLVKTVKSKMPHKEFILLYPANLRDIVFIFEQDLTLFGTEITLEQHKNHILERVIKIKNASEVECIMILSHYSKWFENLYLQLFNSEMRNKKI